MTDYQNEIPQDLRVKRVEGGVIQWHFTKDLNEDLTPKFMEKIRENVQTSFYARHVYSYKLRHIEHGTAIIYYTNHGSPWMNTLEEVERWLSDKETNRLDSDSIKRPTTKWEFVSHFNVDVKVVLDRQPLMDTGPLPDWLRNLAHGGHAMVALDTYQDNLC